MFISFVDRIPFLVVVGLRGLFLFDYKLRAVLFIDFFKELSACFLAVLGLCCCMWALSSFRELKQLLFSVFSSWWRLLSWSMGSQAHRLQWLQSVGSIVVALWAEPLLSMWALSRPGIEPVSPALAGRFLSSVPVGKPCCSRF